MSGAWKKPSNASRFVIAITGASLVVFATWKVRHSSDASRAVAHKTIARSVAALRTDETKKARIQQSSDARPEGKATGNFSVSITGDDTGGGSLETMPRAATRFRLHGMINAERELPSHEFSWILPKNYRVLNGSLTGVIPNLAAGQMHEVSIVVDRGAEILQPVVLHVFKLVGAEPRGQVAQFDIPDPLIAKPRDAANASKGAASIRDQSYVQ